MGWKQFTQDKKHQGHVGGQHPFDRIELTSQNGELITNILMLGLNAGQGLGSISGLVFTCSRIAKGVVDFHSHRNASFGLSITGRHHTIYFHAFGTGICIKVHCHLPPHCLFSAQLLSSNGSFHAP